jgi:hypothetical protein
MSKRSVGRHLKFIQDKDGKCTKLHVYITVCSPGFRRKGEGLLGGFQLRKAENQHRPVWHRHMHTGYKEHKRLRKNFMPSCLIVQLTTILLICTSKHQSIAIITKTTAVMTIHACINTSNLETNGYATLSFSSCHLLPSNAV